MTYTPKPSTTDVRRASGVWGYETPLAFTQPDFLAKKVSGGGTVTFNEAAEISCGGASGDYATIESPTQFHRFNEFDAVMKSLKHEIVLVIYADTDPSTATAEVFAGMADDGYPANSPDGNEAVVDIKNSQYILNGVAHDASWTVDDLPADRPIVVRIVSDFVNKDTTFELRGWNDSTSTALDVTETFAGAAVFAFNYFRSTYPFFIRSTGTDESFGVSYFRQAFIENSLDE